MYWGRQIGHFCSIWKFYIKRCNGKLWSFSMKLFGGILEKLQNLHLKLQWFHQIHWTQLVSEICDKVLRNHIRKFIRLKIWWKDKKKSSYDFAWWWISRNNLWLIREEESQKQRWRKWWKKRWVSRREGIHFARFSLKIFLNIIIFILLK